MAGGFAVDVDQDCLDCTYKQVCLHLSIRLCQSPSSHACKEVLCMKNDLARSMYEAKGCIAELNTQEDKGSQTI